MNSTLLPFASLVLSGASLAMAVPTCPIELQSIENAKPNQLYLFMPSVADPNFPESGCTPGTAGCFSDDGTQVTPAQPFNITDLTDYTGTSAALQSAISDVVTDDYCEFNVHVSMTNTVPPTTSPNRVTVAIGTDDHGGLFGEAQEVDSGDAIAVDYARQWGGTYQGLAGTSGGGELAGANSTVQRWAFALGGTAAHEAGHTFGLTHANGAVVRPGEPGVTTHIMPAGGLVPMSARAGFRRHFDDTSFGILAANVGLSVETLHNWDYTNPNSVDASSLKIELLSTSPTLTLSWFYNGNLSPWTNPTVSGPSGTRTFKGIVYNIFTLTFSTGQPWANGAAGVVPAGSTFHVGAAFSEADFSVPNSVVVSNVTLFDAGSAALTLHPRMIGYDSGALDAADGSLDLQFFNVDNPAAPLIVSDVMVRELPRVLSLQNMIGEGKMESFDGVPVIPWKTTQVRVPEQALGDAVHVLNLANLSQGRHIFQVSDGKCDNNPGPIGSSETGGAAWAVDSTSSPEGVNECPSAGVHLDLFPSTTAFVTATVTDPNATHWDPVQRKLVVGPLSTRVFFQLAGRHPDLNRNHIDDAIDIQTGTSIDTTPHDGVPDEVQRCLDPLHALEQCELDQGNLTVKRDDLLRKQRLVQECEAAGGDLACCPVAEAWICEDEEFGQSVSDAQCQERAESTKRRLERGHFGRQLRLIRRGMCEAQEAVLAHERREIELQLALRGRRCEKDRTRFEVCTGTPRARAALASPGAATGE